VDSCIESIVLASNIIATQQTLMDSFLFTIKNLLQLRETISYYESSLTKSMRTVKLSEIFLALKNVLENPLTLRNYGNLTKPFTATEDYNVRQVLDDKLKSACENFIMEASKTAAKPLVDFLQQAHLKSRSTLFEEAFASKEAILHVHQQFLDSLNTHLTTAVSKLRQYLGDKSTQLTLIRIIRVLCLHFNSRIPSFLKQMTLSIW
jgi:hypothetical protein